MFKIWNKELNRVYKKIPFKAEVEFRFKVKDLESIGIYIEYGEWQTDFYYFLLLIIFLLQYMGRLFL